MPEFYPVVFREPDVWGVGENEQGEPCIKCKVPAEELKKTEENNNLFEDDGTGQFRIAL